MVSLVCPSSPQKHQRAFGVLFVSNQLKLTRITFPTPLLEIGLHSKARYIVTPTFGPASELLICITKLSTIFYTTGVEAEWKSQVYF